MPDEQEPERGTAWRVTPLAVVLGLVAAGLLAWAYVSTGRPDAQAVAQQAEIEKMVKGMNDGAAVVTGFREKTRRLIDPLELLLAMDKSLEARGLPPQSARAFTEQLATADRKLAADPRLVGYIDTCRQREEIEKHQLYQGIHGPIRALPGWAKDWQTRCKSFLAPP